MKTDELTGDALDWAVAQCEGVAIESFMAAQSFDEHAYQYSTGWAQGGPIFEREEICVLAPVRGLWRGRKEGRTQYGPTPLIAAMRCYVAAKLGDEVEIPEELI